jgi:hypothetical protein
MGACEALLIPPAENDDRYQPKAEHVARLHLVVSFPPRRQSRQPSARLTMPRTKTKHSQETSLRYSITLVDEDRPINNNSRTRPTRVCKPTRTLTITVVPPSTLARASKLQFSPSRIVHAAHIFGPQAWGERVPRLHEQAFCPSAGTARPSQTIEIVEKRPSTDKHGCRRRGCEAVAQPGTALV